MSCATQIHNGYIVNCSSNSNALGNKSFTCNIVCNYLTDAKLNDTTVVLTCFSKEWSADIQQVCLPSVDTSSNGFTIILLIAVILVLFLGICCFWGFQKKLLPWQKKEQPFARITDDSLEMVDAPLPRSNDLAPTFSSLLQPGHTSESEVNQDIEHGKLVESKHGEDE